MRTAYWSFLQLQHRQVIELLKSHIVNTVVLVIFSKIMCTFVQILFGFQISEGMKICIFEYKFIERILILILTLHGGSE